MSSSLSLNKRSSRRLLKDKIAKLTIASGGILVLVALLLIFLYLLYVVMPVFSAADISQRSRLVKETSSILAMGTDERVSMAYLVQNDASIQYISLKSAADTDSESQPQVSEQQIIHASQKNLVALASDNQASPSYALVFEHGELLLVKPEFESVVGQPQGQVTPKLTYPMGEAPIKINGVLSAPKQVFIGQLAEQLLVAILSEQNELSLHYLFAGEKGEWQQKQIALNMSLSGVEQVLFSPDLGRIYLTGTQRLQVFDFRTREQANLLADVVLTSAEIKHIVLLAGGESLIVNTSDGVVSQWFSAPAEFGPMYHKVREFEVNFTVKAIYPEPYQKGFVLTGSQGEMGLYFASQTSPLWESDATGEAIEQLSIAPYSNGLLAATTRGVDYYAMSNAHPDVSWEALWHEVWYENYPEKDYVWQSTSAADEYQAKFSLVPLTFGTLKAALYAMLFSIPLALSAAVYTAYFMSASMRNWVKPGIEIIEALPTVILGFMAGIWLAPIVEENLLGLISFSLLLPVAIILAALLWQQVPQALKDKYHTGWHGILLIPIVILVMLASFSFSPTLESWIFAGDVRHYLSEQWSIDYDQRNALVIGIAMGFAVTPTIFSIAEDAIGNVPRHLTDGSLALGATQWQTVLRVVLLTASPGIFAAVMMGLGRAVGETMIVLMATGNTPLTDWNIFQGMRTLAANIAIEMPESEVNSSHYRILFLSAFVLFIFTFVFNTAAEFVRQNLRDKYSRL